MTFDRAREIDLSQQRNSSQLVARVSGAAEGGRPVRIKINAKLVQSFSPDWGELTGALEACEKFDRCSAVVERREKSGGKVTSVTHWLWVGPDGGLTTDDAIELGRIQSLLEAKAGKWQHAVRARTISFKSTKVNASYPTLELLHRIRSDGLPPDDRRAATMVFVASHAAGKVQWEVKLRPL